jgi:hypothetical protein
MKKIIIGAMLLISLAIMVGAQEINETNETEPINDTTEPVNITAGEMWVMKHLCENMTAQEFEELDTLEEKIVACPTILLPGDEPVEDTVTGGNYDFNIVVEDETGQTWNITEAELVHSLVCLETEVTNQTNQTTTEVCYDVSYYAFRNVTMGLVNVTETQFPENVNTSIFELDPESDEEIILERTQDSITVNTTGKFGQTVHVFNMREEPVEPVPPVPPVDVTEIRIMKHLCDEDFTVEDIEDLETLEEKVQECPVIVLSGDEPFEGTETGGNWDFNIMVEDDTGERWNIEDAEFVQDVICADDNQTCYDASYYIFRNITIGDVAIIEDEFPDDTRFGAIIVDRDEYVVESMVGIIRLNITEETEVMAHVFNIRLEEPVEPPVTPPVTPPTEPPFEEPVPPEAIDANLFIKEWYPKGPDFVFVCEVEGFTPTAYSWFYGDGHKLLNITNRDTYHVYEELGEYEVMCIATDGVNIASDTLMIEVTSLERPVVDIPRDVEVPVEDIIADAECRDIAEALNGIAVQHHDICSVVIPRMEPDMTREGRDLNWFVLMNSMIEFHPVPGDDNVFAVGKLVLTESEYNQIQEMELDNWQIIGIVDPVMAIQPDMVFMYWTTEGNLNDIISQVNNVLDMTGIDGTTEPFAWRITEIREVIEQEEVDEVPADEEEVVDEQPVEEDPVDEEVVDEEYTFEAVLTGEQEAEPVETGATGQATATISNNLLTVSGSFEGLESDLYEIAGSSAHIHIGERGEPGPVVWSLLVSPNPDNRSGTFSILQAELTDEEVENFREGLYFINVHTVENPEGEIRGQLE